VPRDRNGKFKPKGLKKYKTSSNELEDKIITLYAKGMSMRDVQATPQEVYGLDISASTHSPIMEKIWPLVEAWQNRRLERVVSGCNSREPAPPRTYRDDRCVYHAGGGFDRAQGCWIGDGAEGRSSGRTC
jgi:hypothetical protein